MQKIFTVVLFVSMFVPLLGMDKGVGQKAPDSQSAVVPIGDSAGAFVQALESGDGLAVKGVLAQYPALVNEKHFFKGGYTPLHWTVKNYCPRLVKILLQAGADPNIANDRRVTPLSTAVLMPAIDIVELLLKHRARVDVRCLCRVVRAPDSLTLCDLLTACDDLSVINERFGKTGYTPLHWAVKDYQPPYIMKILLRAGANPNIANFRGKSPLHTAVHKNRPKIVSLLLEHAANPDLADSKGITPLKLAETKGYAECVSFLRAAMPMQPEVAEPGLQAATTSVAPEVTSVQEYGNTSANADETIEDWPSIVMKFLNLKQQSDMQEMLTAYPKIKEWKAEKSGYTALYWAITLDRPLAVRALLDANVDPNSATSSGRMPLKVALDGNRKEYVDLLLQHGARVDAICLSYASREQKGYLPSLIKYCDPAVLNEVIDGADPLLHNVVRKNDTQLLQAMIEKGVDLSVCARDGHTALERAIYLGHAQSVLMLLKAGARVTPDYLQYALEIFRRLAYRVDFVHLDNDSLHQVRPVFPLEALPPLPVLPERPFLCPRGDDVKAVLLGLCTEESSTKDRSWNLSHIPTHEYQLGQEVVDSDCEQVYQYLLRCTPKPGNAAVPVCSVAVSSPSSGDASQTALSAKSDLAVSPTPPLVPAQSDVKLVQRVVVQATTAAVTQVPAARTSGMFGWLKSFWRACPVLHRWSPCVVGRSICSCLLSWLHF